MAWSKNLGAFNKWVFAVRTIGSHATATIAERGARQVVFSTGAALSGTFGTIAPDSILLRY